MPTYNVEKYIHRAIDSILAQTVESWKLIIVDDCSSDSTPEIINRYASDDNRISVYSMARQSGSAYAPRRRAIELADSDFVAPLDSDDFIPSNYLEQLIDAQQKHNADIVYPTMYRVDTDEIIIDESSRLVPKAGCTLYEKAMPGRDCVAMTLNGWSIGAGGGIIRKDVYMRAFQQFRTDTSAIFADELLTRHLLLLAGTVAVSQAPYLYRNNTSSVTSLQSPRIFTMLSSDKALIDFCAQHFGCDSREFLLAHMQNFHHIFDYSRLLNRNRFTRDGHQLARRLISDAIDNVDFKLIKPHVSQRYFMLLRLNRFIPVRFSLRIIDKIMGKTSKSLS